MIDYMKVVTGPGFQSMAQRLDPLETYDAASGEVLDRVLNHSDEQEHPLLPFLLQNVPLFDPKNTERFYAEFKQRVSERLPPQTNEATVTHLMKACLIRQVQVLQRDSKNLARTESQDHYWPGRIYSHLTHFASHWKQYQQYAAVIKGLATETSLPLPDTLKRNMLILITMLGIASLTLPSFATGLGLGLAHYVIKIPVGLVAQTTYQDASDRDTSSFPIDFFQTTLVAPIGEELLVNGAMLSVATAITRYVSPTLFESFWIGSITSAHLVALVAVESLFGLAHAFNPTFSGQVDRGAVLVTGVNGLLMGLTAIQYGLTASIAFHILNNTIAVGAIGLESWSRST